MPQALDTLFHEKCLTSVLDPLQDSLDLQHGTLITTPFGVRKSLPAP